MRRTLAILIALVITIPTAAFAASSFTDVPDGAFFEDPVEWAYMNGITTGRTDTTFDPYAPTTRGELVTFLNRYHDAFGIDPSSIEPNTDTLADLSCEAGEIPKWSGSAWACGEDVDTTIPDTDTTIPNTDTLADLSCTADQVAIDDGGWRCADPIIERTYGGFHDQALVSAGSAGAFNDMAIGVDGNPVIAHYESAGDDLELYVCDDPLCTSGTNRELQATGFAGFWPSIAISSTGVPLIARHDDTGFRLYVCDDAACTSGTDRLINASALISQYPIIKIAPDGNPVIGGYTDPSDGMLYVCDDPTCTTGTNFTVIDGSGGEDVDMALHDDGRPVMTYYDANTGDLDVYVCADVACAGGVERTLVVGNVHEEPAVAINGLGNPVVVHHDRTLDTIELYVCDDSTCATGTNRDIVAGSDTGFTPDITTNADGVPVLTYQSDSSLVMYVCDDAACTDGTEYVLDSGSTDGSRSSIVFDEFGRALIAHQAGGGDLHLAVADFIATGVSFD